MGRSTDIRFPPPGSLLIAAIQGIGDLVLSTPALKAMRARFPTSVLALAAPADCIDILAGESYIDERFPLPLDTSGGVFTAWRRLREVTRRIARCRYDLLIDLTTPLHIATLAKCRLFHRLCAPRKVIAPGLADCLLWSPRRERIAYRHTTHEAHRKLNYLRGVIPEFHFAAPSLDVDRQPGERTLTHLRPLGGYLVGIAPGAARQSRQWPIERFGEVARRFSADSRLKVVVLGGPQDHPPANRIVRDAGNQVVDLTGRVALHDIPSTVATLDVLVCNDSGLMHVAAAVRTPLVALLGAEDPRRYSPLADPSRAHVFYRHAACSPCRRSICSHRSCTSWITPEEVARAALALLGRQDSGTDHPATIPLPSADSLPVLAGATAP